MTSQTFQQDIVKELGIDQLPQERQGEALAVMTEVILKRLTLKLLGGLSDAQRADFATLAEGGEVEKINTFFSQNVPGYEKIIQDELDAFKNEMAETVNALLA